MTVQTLDAPRTKAAPTIRAKPKNSAHKNGKVKTALPAKKITPVTRENAPGRVVMWPIYVPEIELPVFNLPEEDGIPLETNWHRAEGSLLIDSYQQHRGTERNYYAGANMFVYFSSQQVRNQDFRGPDFFVVLDVDGSYDRRSWIVWEENGRYPNVIVELMSITTADEDRTTKRALYANTFGTQNYFYFHPDTQEFQGFELVNGDYQELTADPQGRFWCAALRLWLGTWTGEYQGQTHIWVRFYDSNGDLILTREEAERQRAVEEQQRAEEERQRAEEERQRAEEERQRAEAAETELARMRTHLRQLGIDPDKV